MFPIYFLCHILDQEYMNAAFSATGSSLNDDNPYEPTDCAAAKPSVMYNLSYLIFKNVGDRIHVYDTYFA